MYRHIYTIYQLGQQCPSAIPQSRKKYLLSVPRTFYVSLAWKPGNRDSRYSGKNSILLLRSFLFFSFSFILKSLSFRFSSSLFRLPLATGGGRRFTCLTDQYLPPYLLSGIFSHNKQNLVVDVDRAADFFKRNKTGFYIQLLLFVEIVRAGGRGG